MRAREGYSARMNSKKKVVLTLAAMCAVGLASREVYALWQPNTTTAAQYVEFDTISEVRVAEDLNRGIPTITLRGTPTGSTVPTEWNVAAGPVMIEACHRSALLMMNRPGRFVLRSIQERPYANGPPASACSLAARGP